MSNIIRKIIAVVILVLSVNPLFAQETSQNAATSLPNFAPQTSGFKFKNFGNNGHKWDDDLGAADLIRLVGVKATCIQGDNANNCVMKAAPRKWLEEYLKAIDKGRCTGMAVASLRFLTNQGFRGKSSAQLLTTAKIPFNLALDPFMENYVSYYWLTQVFDEVKKPKDATAKKGPVEIAKMLKDALETKKEFYTMSLKKYDNGRMFDGHEFTPFAVEETETQYKISVYDNNFPGETRHLFISKTAAQTWTYSSSKDQKEKADYVGDIKTQTLALTANSWRDGKCFDPPFGSDGTRPTGCGNEAVSFLRTSFSNRQTDDDGEDAEFFLTGEGEMLVTDGNGKRIGYDPKSGKYFNEFPEGYSDLLIGGLGFDLPQFTLPYFESEKPYTVVFSGKNVSGESIMDFVFSAPGFTVGFEGIRLDPNETLTATISPDGEEISFTASADGETPLVFFAFDDEEEEGASYITEVGGILLDAGKSLTYNFDFENGKLFFSDNDGNEDEYDIELIRINPDGTENVYKKENLDIGDKDSYEMNFGEWNGEDDICFKDDEDGDGFGDEECTEVPDEEEEPDQN